MIKKKKRTTKSYDSPYKQMFSNLTFFRQLLETFVPEGFVKEIDFNSCIKIDKSFVSKKYDKTESDIIYKVKLKNGKEVYIYILLEFQSTVDKFMSVRMLNYITNLYIDMISASRKESNVSTYLDTAQQPHLNINISDSINKNKNKPKRSKNKLLDVLPPVFPILLYNGDEKWTAKQDISELIENNHLLGNYGINFKYFKIIEMENTKEKLLKMKNLVSNLFLFETKIKEIDEKLFDEELSKLYKTEEDKEAIKMLINYFKYMLIGDKINKEKYNLLDEIEFENTEGDTMFSTVVKNERIKFKHEGETEKAFFIAKNLLEIGLSLEQISKATGLSLKDIEKITSCRGKSEI